MNPGAVGAMLLAASVGCHVGVTRPIAAEADVLHKEFARLRGDVDGDGEARTRARALAAWTKAAAVAASSTKDANPMLSLRRRVLTATESAGLRDVSLDVSAVRPPFGASARLSGDAGFAGLMRLLDAIDPESQGLVPQSVSVSRSEAEGDLTFALELLVASVPQTSPDRGSGAGASAPVGPGRPSVTPWSRDPFGFQERALGPTPPSVVIRVPLPSTPEPSLMSSGDVTSAEPSIRLVGLVRKRGTLLAVVSAGGQIHVLGPGAEADGFRIVSVDEDAVTVREQGGAEMVLTPRN